MQYFLNFVFDSNFDGHNNPLTFNIVLSPPPTLHTLSYTISQVHSSSSGNPNSSYLNKNNTTKAAADIEMEMGKETGKLNDLSVINGQLRLHLEQPHASDSIRSKLSLDSVAASVPVLPLEVWWRVAR